MKSRQHKILSRSLAEENKRYPDTLAVVPKERWPRPYPGRKGPDAMLRSRRFLVQLFGEPNGIIRLSVNRTAIARDGRWVDGIAWDELQRLKNEAGFGDRQAVEIYPPYGDVVDDANMRHLWILPEPLPFAWTRENAS